MTQSDTNSRYRRQTLIMRVNEGFYPIMSAGKRPLKEEAQDHGKLNSHINSIEDVDGNVLWRRQ